MISWGIVSAAFAFIPSIAGATGASNETVFYTLRLLLGACEAGFFPGIIFYLTLWFPAVPRSGHQLFHVGDPDFIYRWGADLRAVAKRDWLGAGRLAMAVHPGGVAIDSGGTRRVVLSDRLPAPSPLAAAG